MCFIESASLVDNVCVLDIHCVCIYRDTLSKYKSMNKLFVKFSKIFKCYNYVLDMFEKAIRCSVIHTGVEFCPCDQITHNVDGDFAIRFFSSEIDLLYTF